MNVQQFNPRIQTPIRPPVRLDDSEFLKWQYDALRKEIDATKDRIFKTTGFGLVAIPIANSIAYIYQAKPLVLLLPVLVIVVALVYLSENQALMRCGRYIRLQIEPRAKGVVGWETWLESHDPFGPRDVDEHLTRSFLLLFLIYLIASVYLASQVVLSDFGQVAPYLLGGYAAIGVWFIIYLIKNLRTATSTRTDSGLINDEAPEGSHIVND